MAFHTHTHNKLTKVTEVSTSQLLLKQSNGHAGDKLTEVEMTDYGQMVIHKQQVYNLS